MRFVRQVTNAFCWFLLTLVFATCQPRTPSEPTTLETDSTLLADSSKVFARTDSLPQSTDSVACIRSHAEPVIKSTVHPKSVFVLNNDGHTGKETIEFGNGDRLVIKNWGCEYYILTFRFETTRFKGDTTDTVYWLDKVVTLMNGLESGLDTPLDITAGTSAVKNLLNGEPSYNLGEEIVYDDNEIREYVTIDRIQQMKSDRFAVEVSYTMGPL